MKYVTPEISWHSRDPLYSVDLQYSCGQLRRLATCGTDKVIRLWEVKLSKSCFTSKEKSVATVEFLSTLNRHLRAVNVVRFSPDGSILASGADDATVILWRLNDISPSANFMQDDEEENRESWTAFKVLRSHLEDVYDISWSADNKLLLSGSVDNTAILWDLKKGHKLWMFTEHKGFVQGVAIDPLNQYLATLSDDRSLRLFSLTSRQLVHDVKRIQTAGNKSIRMFHSAETMKTFFRRLDFSPDGLLLVAPAGCWETVSAAADSGSAAGINTSYVFCRSNLTRPVMSLVGPSKPTLVVRFCPRLFELRKIPRRVPLQHCDGISECDQQEWMKYETLFRLSYRMIFAVASEEAVYLYDTQQPRPLAYLANLHYHTLSDLSWSHDGQLLVVSSTDGYCTLVTFGENELGTAYKKCDDVISPVETILEIAEPQVKTAELSKKSDIVQTVITPAETIRETAEPQVKTAELSKKPDVVQTESFVKPVCLDSSPQRKKARRVVLQTISTNVENCTQIPCETTTCKSEVAENVVVSEVVLSHTEKCQPVVNPMYVGSSRPSCDKMDDLSSKTNCELVACSIEPESMEVCEDVQLTKVHDTVGTESCQTDLHLVLELSSDTASSMMPPSSFTTVPASARQPTSCPTTSSSMNTSASPAQTGTNTSGSPAQPGSDKQKPPRRVQLTTLT